MFTSKIFITFIRIYQRCFSILRPPSCRFFPTCSQYSIEVLEEYGVMRGAYKTIFRLLRCHPFHPGGFDPVK